MQNIAQTLTPIELENPFFKEKIVATNVWAGYDMLGNPVATGYIQFRQNMTVGQQDFKGRTFDEVIHKMKAFLNNLG